MTDFGNKKKKSRIAPVLVYYDFENALTFNEILERTRFRYNELIIQGFSKEEALKIIFECQFFKDSFLNERRFFALKDKINTL